MFSVIHEWVAYIYGIFQFLGFGRSPLLNVQDKYTEPESVTTIDVPTLHLSSFKTPTSNFVRRAEMSEESRTDCASLMRNGVNHNRIVDFQNEEDRVEYYMV